MSKEKITLEKTNRGFAYGEFNDGNGQSCSIQKSSTFGDENGEYIWLGCNNPDREVKILKPGVHGWKTVSLKDTFPGCDIVIPNRMHLSQEDVKKILPILQHFAKTGEVRYPKTRRKSVKV
jgi:hypothetical protein